jgi:hypothetical protein
MDRIFSCSPSWLARFIAASLVCLIATTCAVAQSGMLMNNGGSISAGANQVSIFADSSTNRAKIINYSFNTGAFPIATWPCTTLGGIVYGGTVPVGTGVATETCLSGNTSGTGILTENSSGTASWGTTSGNTTTLATTTGTLTSGDLAKFDGSGNIEDDGISLLTLSGNTTIATTANANLTSANSGQVVTIDSNGNAQASGFTSGGAISACYSQAPVTVNTTSSSAHNLMTCTIPAGALNSQYANLHIEVSGVLSIPSGNTATDVTVAFNLGSTPLTLCTRSSTATTPANQTNVPWRAVCDATVETAGSSAAFETAELLMVPTSTAIAEPYLTNNTSTVSSINLMNSQALQITFAFATAGTTNNTVTQRMLRARVEN